MSHHGLDRVGRREMKRYNKAYRRVFGRHAVWGGLCVSLFVAIWALAINREVRHETSPCYTQTLLFMHDFLRALYGFEFVISGFLFVAFLQHKRKVKALPQLIIVGSMAMQLGLLIAAIVLLVRARHVDDPCNDVWYVLSVRTLTVIWSVLVILLWMRIGKLYHAHQRMMESETVPILHNAHPALGQGQPQQQQQYGAAVPSVMPRAYAAPVAYMGAPGQSQGVPYAVEYGQQQSYKQQGYQPPAQQFAAPPPSAPPPPAGAHV